MRDMPLHSTHFDRSLARLKMVLMRSATDANDGATSVQHRCNIGDEAMMNAGKQRTITNWGKHPKLKSDWVRRVQVNEPAVGQDSALEIYNNLLDKSAYNDALQVTFNTIQDDLIARVDEVCFANGIDSMTLQEYEMKVCTEWVDGAARMLRKYGLTIEELPKYELPLRVYMGVHGRQRIGTVSMLVLNDDLEFTEVEVQNGTLVTEMIKLATYIHDHIHEIGMCIACKIAYNYQILVSIVEYKFADSENKLAYYQDFSNSAKQQLAQLQSMLMSSVVLIPTFDVLSYKTLIKLADVPLYPLGMANSSVKAHGVTLFPVLYFLHDIGHAWHFFTKKKHRYFDTELYLKNVQDKYNVLDIVRERIKQDQKTGFDYQLIIFFMCHELDISLDITTAKLTDLLCRQKPNSGWIGDYIIVDKIAQAWLKDMHHLMREEHIRHYGKMYICENELRKDFNIALARLVKEISDRVIPEHRIPLSEFYRKQGMSNVICECIESLEMFTFVLPQEIHIAFGWEDRISIHDVLRSTRVRGLPPGVAKSLCNSLLPAIDQLMARGFSFTEIAKGLCTGNRRDDVVQVIHTLLSQDTTCFPWIFYIGLDLKYKQNFYTSSEILTLRALWKERMTYFNHLCTYLDL